MTMTRWPERTLAERFWEKVDQTGDCWTWTAAKHRRGYGAFVIRKGVVVQAHRLAYELTNGAIPAEYEIDHLCFNPSCVRPEHLQLISPPDHRQQGGDRRRAQAAQQTHCKHGHPLDIVRSGRRRCSVCLREVYRKANAKRRR